MTLAITDDQRDLAHTAADLLARRGATAGARALLEAEGYFNARIVTKVSDEVEGQPVIVSMEVDPGPQTVVSKVQFVFEGDLDTRLANSDPLAQALLDRLERNWALPEGQVFRQADWSAAKNGALARMRAAYPTAWSPAAAGYAFSARA